MPRQPRGRDSKKDLFDTMVRCGEMNPESGLQTTMFAKRGVFRTRDVRAEFLRDLKEYIDGTVPMYVAGVYVDWCLYGRNFVGASYHRHIHVYLAKGAPSFVEDLLQ